MNDIVPHAGVSESNSQSNPADGSDRVKAPVAVESPTDCGEGNQQPTGGRATPNTAEEGQDALEGGQETPRKEEEKEEIVSLVSSDEEGDERDDWRTPAGKRKVQAILSTSSSGGSSAGSSSTIKVQRKKKCDGQDDVVNNLTTEMTTEEVPASELNRTLRDGSNEIGETQQESTLVPLAIKVYPPLPAGNVPAEETTDELHATETLRTKAESEVKNITSMVSRSKNLKGTFQKGIKDSVRKLQELVDILADRSESSQLRETLEVNAQMRTELRALRAEREAATREIAHLREALNEKELGLCPPIRTLTTTTPEPDGERERRQADSLAGLFKGLEERMEARMEARLTALVKHLTGKEERAAKLRTPSTRTPTTEGAQRPIIRATDNATPTRGARTPVVEREAPDNDALARNTDEQAGTSWAQVLSRRAKKAVRQEEPAVKNPTTTTAPATTWVKKNKKKIRAPSTAAVILTTPAGSEGGTMAILTEAKQTIALAQIGITSLRTRKGFTGATILEIPGENAGEKADRLAEELQRVAGDRARITRPTKTAELRLSRLDETSNSEEISAALAAVGECRWEDFKIGQINRNQWGAGTAWVRCPAKAAVKLAKAKTVQIGWTTAVVTPLNNRPSRCFRCLEEGHARDVCTSETDRSSRCYRCGDTHKAATCRRKPKCPLCTDIGRPSDHCLGAASCKSQPRRGERTVKTRDPTSQTLANAGEIGRPSATDDPPTSEMEVETRSSSDGL